MTAQIIVLPVVPVERATVAPTSIDLHTRHRRETEAFVQSRTVPRGRPIGPTRDSQVQDEILAVYNPPITTNGQRWASCVIQSSRYDSVRTGVPCGRPGAIRKIACPFIGCSDRPKISRRQTKVLAGLNAALSVFYLKALTTASIPAALGWGMEILCGIISFIVAMAGIWTITSLLSQGWAIAVGLALVVIVSFAHAGSLAPESLGRKRIVDRDQSNPKTAHDS
jgi:hypothetical protein